MCYFVSHPFQVYYPYANQFGFSTSILPCEWNTQRTGGVTLTLPFLLRCRSPSLPAKSSSQDDVGVFSIYPRAITARKNYLIVDGAVNKNRSSRILPLPRRLHTFRKGGIRNTNGKQTIFKETNSSQRHSCTQLYRIYHVNITCHWQGCGVVLHVRLHCTKWHCNSSLVLLPPNILWHEICPYKRK